MEKQLGDSQYNDAILSIYGGNPVATISESYKPKQQPLLPKLGKSKKIGSGDLNKETYKMMLAAKANLNLKKKILKYEVARFKQLKVDLSSGLKKSKKKKDKDLLGLPKTKKEASNTSISSWMKRLIKRMFDRTKAKLARWIKRSIKRLLGKKGIKLVRKFLNPIRKFRARGGVRGFLFRNFKRLNLRILGRSRYLRAARFIRGGGVTGFVRRRFFKAVESIRANGVGGTINSVKGNAGRMFNALKGGASAATNFVSAQAQKVTNFTGKVGDDVVKNTTKFGDDFLKGLRGVGSGIMGFARKAVDPQTYKGIYDDVVGKPLAALGEKSKKVIDDLAGWVANSKMFRKIVESKVGKRVMKKLGQIVFKKLVMRLIVGVGTVMAIWDAIDAWLKGDYEGATIKLISAIPVVGIPALIVDILRDLFPETWENIVSDMMGADKETRNKNIKNIADVTTKGYQDLGTGYNDAGFGAGFGIDGQAAEGMEVGAHPQLVLVGEGGEKEWIVPESKLLHWLGSTTGIQLLNLGAFDVINTSKSFLRAMGVSSSIIPDLPPEAPTTVGANVNVKKPNAIGDFGKKIVEFIVKGFEGIRDGFKDILEKFRSFLPDLSKLHPWVKNQLRWLATKGGDGMVALIDFLLGGGAAKAATTGGGNTPGTALTGGGYEYTDPDTKTQIVVTSEYGVNRGNKNHGGTDIATKSGTPLRAISDGKIIETGFESGWGNFLVFKDDKGIYHLYGHVQGGYKRGGQVKKGEVLAKVGSTGRSSGPHLHWETGTSWNGTIGGKFNPLSRYTAQQPFFTAADKKDDKKPPTPTATTPEKPKPPVRTSSSSKGSTSQYRGGPNRSGKPIAAAPLNKKDTASALEKFGTMDEDNNQEVAVIEVPVTRTITVPMPLPLQTASVGSSGNTPAWGQGAVRGA